MQLQIIQQKIFEIRGHKVTLDSDLAELYEVKTKVLNQAAKMNIAIVRAFIALRKFAAQYSELLEQLNELKERIGNHDAQLN